MIYLVLIGVVAIAGVVGFVLGKKVGDGGVGKEEPYFAAASGDELRDIQGEAKEALDEWTQKRKEKILHMIRTEAETQKELEDCSGEVVVGGITRVDVEELLEVSEGTARKYLNMLEEERKRGR